METKEVLFSDVWVDSTGPFVYGCGEDDLLQVRDIRFTLVERDGIDDVVLDTTRGTGSRFRGDAQFVGSVT